MSKDRKHRAGPLLHTVAVLQLLEGGLIVGGCACRPSLRSVGSVVALAMGAFVVAFILLGTWARQRPRPATWSALATEFLLVAMMAIPYVHPPMAAWMIQVVAAIFVLGALVSAHSKERAAKG